MKLIFTLTFSFLVLCGFSQNPWQKVSEIDIITKKTGERLTIPEKYDTYTLDMAQVQQQLAKAPLTKFSDDSKKATMTLPLANGTTEIFAFVESPAMSPVLAAKFPNIKSFKGQSTTNPSHKAWIDYSPSGFRAAINSPMGIVYIDPYFGNADENYIVYYVKDHKPDISDLKGGCSVDAYEEEIKEQNNLLDPNAQTTRNKNLGMPVIKATYRFALACTAQWGDQQGADLMGIMSKMNSATNRLNSFFEPELAMKLELVDNNDELIFFGTNDPYTIIPNADDGSHPGRQVLQQNTDVLNRAIGVNSYDLGHVFTIRCTDGIAGVANFGICEGTKGNGVSCLGNSNISNFMTSTTAHELGHQFTAGHTWGNCPPSVDQFSAASNCEPGSGSTIMSYFGLCGPSENLTGAEFPYYHVCSLEPIYNYVATGVAGTCGSHDPQDNSIPDVWIEQEGGFTIPISTPFELTGYATDMDGDELLHNWDQINRAGIAYPLGSPVGDSPSFRSFPPSTRTTRVFPKISDVLAGRDNIEERLPTYSRKLDFAFVARDGNLDAGGVSWTTIGFEASDMAGPFRVTSPSQFTSTTVGDYLDVEWNVANTDQAPVNARFVDIYLSNDGGLTFPNLILERTANDGSERVRIPNITGDNCKIKVKGSGNIFFNVSRNILNIEEATTPGYFLSASQNYFQPCLPASIETEIAGASFLGFSDDIALDVVSGLPAIASYNFEESVISADGSTTLSIDMSEVLYTGVYEVLVRGIAGTDTVFQTINIDATGTDLSDLSLTTPPNNARGLSAIPDFEWEGSPNAVAYRLEVATSPSFEGSDLIISKSTGLETTGTDLVNLENSTLYYWRVITINDCIGEVASPISTFSSNALSCNIFAATDTPINISSSGTPTVSSVINITGAGTISDLNVNLVKGNHNSIASLRTSLTSPSGTNVILFQGACLNNTVINAGFDSDSAFPNGCPDKNGNKIKPFEDLSILNGESTQGAWTLTIEDTQAGSGGTLTDFELELCSTGALFSPFVVNNEVLEVLTGSDNKLETIDLLCEDENNNAAELRYTLVVGPAIGTLLQNNNPLRVGSRFTQNDINSGALKYRHDGTEDAQDSFVFVVEDGEGGWIDPTTFIINMSQDGDTGVEDIKDATSYFKIFPNPASDIINITQLEQGNSEWSLEVTSLDGKRVATKTFNAATELNVTEYESGIYILKISNQEVEVSQKVTVVRD